MTYKIKTFGKPVSFLLFELFAGSFSYCQFWFLLLLHTNFFFLGVLWKIFSKTFYESHF